MNYSYFIGEFEMLFIIRFICIIQICTINWTNLKLMLLEEGHDWIPEILQHRSRA